MVSVDPTAEINRHHDLRIPVGSETVAATRYQPVGVDGPLPALLMYVPYHKDDWITYGAYDPLNRYLAASGYEVVVADMVGTGASSGAVDEMFLRREGKEGAAIVEWLADRDWTDGRVGMYGKSYGGITALDTAAQRPDALEAIVPIETPYMGYRNAYTNGGLFELFTIGMDWLTLMQVLDVKPPSRRDPDGRWAEVWRQHLDAVRDREPWLFQFLDHPRKDDYWADKDIPVENVETPTLAVGGWRDPYTIDTAEFFEAIDAEKRLLWGPWRHHMPHRGYESAIDFRRQVVEWFDHFLKDADNGALDRPTFTLWTERNRGDAVGGVWRERNTWPTVESGVSDPYRVQEFALTPDGLRHPDEYGEEGGAVDREYQLDYTVGLESTVPYRMGVPSQDTNADDARSVCFESEPLADPLELTGTGEAIVGLTSSLADPTLSVRIVDVAPSGAARMVTHGTVRASRLDGLSATRSVQPGAADEFAVPLEPRSHVFDAGHRIRVAIAGAFFPEAMPTGMSGSFTVHSDPDAPSMIRFPGRTLDETGFDDTVEMSPPDESVPPTQERVVRSDGSWQTIRDRTDDSATVRMTTDNALDLPHVDMRETGTFEVTVRSDDPRSVVARNELDVALEYDAERVDIRATNRISRDVCALTTEVTIDGEPFFEKTYTR